MAAHLLGIDVSTTGIKALLMDDNGAVVGKTTSDVPLSSPQPLWSEQNPADWWEGTIRSVRRVLLTAGLRGEDVAAIGLTGQMHGLTVLDEAGEVLRPAILWNDQRTEEECDLIRKRLGRENLIRITGNDALTGFTAPKILWVQRKEPDVFSAIRHVLLPKDYVRFKLTDAYATDRAGGSGTILFDLAARDWSVQVLDALGIPFEWVPPTHEGPDVTGYVSREAEEVTGLKKGTPVVAGGGDQAAQAVGVGALHPGIVALTLGTSGVVFACTDGPCVETQGRLHAFCHAVPGRWHLMGVMLSAGGSLRWFRDTLAPGSSYDDLLTPVLRIPRGSEGLLFLPYLTGERTPYPDPKARGAFVGLTMRHTVHHLTRAVLEGVAFGLCDCLHLLQSTGLEKTTKVRVSGGGSKSSLWRRILADVLNAELETVNTSEGAAYGAALLAGVGAGVWPNVDAACATCVKVTGSSVPNPHAVAQYDALYTLYRQLYPSLRGLTHALSR